MNKYGKIRTIVVERETDKKRCAIYTNAKMEEIETEVIVQLISRRWGEENLIKELMYKHLINYWPGYETEDLEEQPLDGKKLMEFNYERKRFLDCIKVFTYNMEKKMCEILYNYYDIKKEIWPALGMIVKRGGYVRLRDGRLRVQLMRFKDPDIDYAARQLCEDLNQMKPFTMDRYHLPLHYEVI